MSKWPFQREAQPSVFTNDKNFNGRAQSKPKRVDLKPNKNAHITTQAESDRTRSILWRSI